MYLSTLQEWLDWIATIHTTEIELGLDRIKKVAMRLGILKPNCPVIIVGGTNGKGSTVAGLEAIYRAAGFKVGAFTSPILIKHNEQVRINGELATDEEFCQAFANVETVRRGTSLTPFEFHTLAALVILKHHELDVLLLEVGLGGRLDAVNILDADVAIVTSISIDHVEWLGNTRESIGFEKAGIFREGKPAVCGDIDPPSTLIEHAAAIGAPLYCQNKNFSLKADTMNWSWSSEKINYTELPPTSLALQNMSTALMAITLLQDRLPVSENAIKKGLSEVTLTGRIEIVNETVMKIFDVAHNPASVAMLAARLKEIPCVGKTVAVFSMLADKDMLTSIQLIDEMIDDWYVAPLSINRGASMETLVEVFAKANIKNAIFFPTIEEAYDRAKMKTELGDRVIVFGSFHTVAKVKISP